jgi:predicted Zn-dependent peptidase
MEASIETLAFDDVGAQVVVVVPKLIGQSLAKAEKLALGQLDSLKAGNFTDDLLGAVKMEMIKENSEYIEESKYRAYSISEVFVYNTEWNDVLNFADEVNSITKEEVIEIANKYYGNNYLAFYSRMGFPKKDKVKKPPYKAVKPSNTEAHSDYYNMVADMESIEMQPKFIIEGEDFFKGEIYPNADFYYVTNPINNVFSLKMKFHMGLAENQKVELAASVLDYCGTDSLSYEDFRKELQKIGSDFYVNSSSNYLTLNISGIEKNVEPTLALLNQLLKNPVLNEKEKIKMVRSLKWDKKFSTRDVATKSYALNDYALHGNQSGYLLSANAKQVKAMSVDELMTITRQVLSRQVQLHYVGKVGAKQFAKMAGIQLNSLKGLEANDKIYAKAIKDTDENLIYFLNDKKAVQTQVKIIVKSDSNRMEDIADSKLFNDYFCGDMSSIVFQEIREFRSLAYSAYGRYVLPINKDYSGYFYGVMTTQADKTIDALETYTSLLNEMPLYPERVEDTKHSLKLSINNDRPSFRSLSSRIPYWKYYGAQNDPNINLYKAYDEAKFSQIEDFYKNYIKDRKMIITLVGDKRRIDMNELTKYGKVIEIKKSDIFNY